MQSELTAFHGAIRDFTKLKQEFEQIYKASLKLIVIID